MEITWISATILLCVIQASNGQRLTVKMITEMKLNEGLLHVHHHVERYVYAHIHK